MTDKKARRKKRHADKMVLEQQARAYLWTPKDGQDRAFAWDNRDNTVAQVDDDRTD